MRNETFRDDFESWVMIRRDLYQLDRVQSWIIYTLKGKGVFWLNAHRKQNENVHGQWVIRNGAYEQRNGSISLAKFYEEYLTGACFK